MINGVHVLPHSMIHIIINIDNFKNNDVLRITIKNGNLTFYYYTCHLKNKAISAQPLKRTKQCLADIESIIP